MVWRCVVSLGINVLDLVMFCGPAHASTLNTVVLSLDSAHIVCSYFEMEKGKVDVIRRVMNQPRIVSKRSFGAMTQVMSGEVAFSKLKRKISNRRSFFLPPPIRLRLSAITFPLFSFDVPISK